MGLILKFKNSYQSEWLTGLTGIQASTLDTMLKLKYGERCLNAIGRTIDDNFNNVADIIYLTYSERWNRLYAGYTAEYNPIYNVDATTTETVTYDTSHTHTGTDTYTHTGDETTETDGTNTIENGIYAFDSSNVSPAAKDVKTPDITEVLTHDTTDENTKDLTLADTGTVTTETVRQGNQGVTMTQQMLQSDVELWNDAKMLFYETVLKDCADYICYKITVD